MARLHEPRLPHGMEGVNANPPPLTGNREQAGSKLPHGTGVSVMGGGPGVCSMMEAGGEVASACDGRGVATWLDGKGGVGRGPPPGPRVRT